MSDSGDATQDGSREQQRRPSIQPIPSGYHPPAGPSSYPGAPLYAPQFPAGDARQYTVRPVPLPQNSASSHFVSSAYLSPALTAPYYMGSPYPQSVLPPTSTPLQYPAYYPYLSYAPHASVEPSGPRMTYSQQHPYAFMSPDASGSGASTPHAYTDSRPAQAMAYAVPRPASVSPLMTSHPHYSHLHYPSSSYHYPTSNPTSPTQAGASYTMPHMDEHSQHWPFVPQTGPPTPGGAEYPHELPMTPQYPPPSPYAGYSDSHPESSSASLRRPPLASLPPSSLGTSPSSSSTGPERPRQRQNQGARRAYQPQPPPNRSEFVMWVGNVPSDSTQDELWRFFTSLPSASPLPARRSPSLEGSTTSTTQPQSHPGGVVSIFLISQSNCAFVNYDSERNLRHAVQVCNGKPLRPDDPRCPKLVCRIRRRDEDFRSGVGAQRGLGMHSRWIHEQAARNRQPSPVDPQGSTPRATSTVPASHTSSDERATSLPPFRSRSSEDLAASVKLARDNDASSLPTASDGSSPSDGSLPPPPPAETPDPASGSTARPLYGESPGSEMQSAGSGSGSWASTTSSFLQRYFPQRYFILKSLTEDDLNLSVQRKAWATQQHNEPVLDQAYRTSKDVFLIFGANKSRTFYGYARMSGPIYSSENRPVSWSTRNFSSPAITPASDNPPEAHDIASPPPTSRSPLSPPQSDASPGVLRSGILNADIYDSPDHLSPGQPILPPDTPGQQIIPPVALPSSAPAEMHHPFKRISNAGAVPRHHETASKSFKLDPEAPNRAIRNVAEEPVLTRELESATQGLAAISVNDPAPPQAMHEEPGAESPSGLHPTVFPNDPSPALLPGEVWGTPFAIDWIRVQRLPFHRTRHIRNPWNQDREVKVSRDGTELEPSVGAKLLAEWDELQPTPSTPAPSSSTSNPRRNTRASRR